MEGLHRLLLLLALLLAGATAALSEKVQIASPTTLVAIAPSSTTTTSRVINKEDKGTAGKVAGAAATEASTGSIKGAAATPSFTTTTARAGAGPTTTRVDNPMKAAPPGTSSSIYITTGARAGPTTTRVNKEEKGAAGEGTSSAISTTAGAGAGTATGNFGDDSKLVVGFNSSRVAAEVALFCRRGLHPGAPCCVAVVSYVDVAGIRRISNEPQLILARLNSTRVLALYNACGGQRALVAAACQGALPPAVNMMLRPPYHFKLSTGEETTCDTQSLATSLAEHCNVDNTVPSRACCSDVLKVIDVEDERCLCYVIEDGWFALSGLDIGYMWQTYTKCGGKKEAVPTDITTCDHAPSPPPSSPPPPPEQKPHHGLPAWVIVCIVLGTILLIFGLVVLYHKLKTAEMADVPQATPAISLVNQPCCSPRRNLPQEPVGSAAAISLPREPGTEDVEEEQAQSKPSITGELVLVPPAARPPPTGPPRPLPQEITLPPPPVMVHMY